MALRSIAGKYKPAEKAPSGKMGMHEKKMHHHMKEAKHHHKEAHSHAMHLAKAAKKHGHKGK